MQQELDKLIRREFGLGDKEAPDKVYYITNPTLPHFRFEWHIGSQKVYRMDLPGMYVEGKWVPGESGLMCNGRIIAEHCLTHGMFIGFVQTFCRGYLLAIQHSFDKSYNSIVSSIGEDPCPKR